MKKRCVTLIALVGGWASSQAQLPMNPGDVYTYSFSSLPFLNNVFAPAPMALMNFTVDGTTLEAGDALSYEVFADVPDGTLLCSGTLNGPPGPAPGGWVCLTASSGWDDLQGAVRFRMLSGSLRLDSVQIGALRFGGPTLAQFYGTTVIPVPEPCTLALLAMGLVCGIVCFRRGRGSCKWVA